VDEDIKQIEINKIKVPRKPSVVVNNFYSLITIVIISVVIIWYVNYILPQQKIAHQKQLQFEKYKKYLKQQNQIRENQIKLSKKLHTKDKHEK